MKKEKKLSYFASMKHQRAAETAIKLVSSTEEFESLLKSEKGALYYWLSRKGYSYQNKTWVSQMAG